MDPQPASTSPESTTAAPEKKSTWGVLLTVTPVILTVLGTVLAGLSNSEMTLAQYFRTLAAQSQSKVGDQWSFFQAKRIRGTTLESVLDLLPVQALPGRLEVAQLDDALSQLKRRQESARLAARELAMVIEGEKAELPEDLRRGVAEWSDAQGKIADANCKEIDALRKRFPALTLDQEALSTYDLPLRRIWEVVSHNRWPDPQAQPILIDKGPLQDAVVVLRQGKKESELGALLLQIRSADVQEEINNAESQAGSFASLAGASSKVLDQLDGQMRNCLYLAYSFHKGLSNLENLLNHAEKKAALSEGVGKALTKLKQCDDETLTAATDLKNVWKAIEHTFTSRRYHLEAEHNREIGYLYEVQVRLNSSAADRHRNRSRHFFYGMLCAQAGVTISALSLAARQRSVLWGIAGLAGLTALLFSVYVYVYV
jgi:hypothetical protein